MEIRRIFCFRNDKKILNAKRAFPNNQIGYILGIFELKKVEGGYAWFCLRDVYGRYVSTEHILNFEKRKRAAKALSKKFNIPIVYTTPKRLSSERYIEINFPFRKSDL